MKHTMTTSPSLTQDREDAQHFGNEDDIKEINDKENTNGNYDCKDNLNSSDECHSKSTNISNPAEEESMNSFQNTRRSFELEKIRRHKLQAAEDIERYKNEKLQRVKEKEEEKKRDLRMLTDFYPWGTTAGKFERGDFRRQKWNLSGNTPRDENNSENRTFSSQPPSSVEPTTNYQSNALQNNNESVTASEMETDKLNIEENEKGDPYNEDIHEKNRDKTAFRYPENDNPNAEKKIYFDCGGKDKSFDNRNHVSPYSMRGNRIQSPSETMRARAARVYMEELKKGMEEQRKRKEEMRREINAPVGELAAVIGMGKVGKPRRDPYTGILLDNHLRTSDVSKNKMGYHSPEDPKFKISYCNDLISAAEERYRLRELEKLKMKQQEKQHQETFNGVWGKPGGGAPRNSNLGNRISNINQIFFKHELEAQNKPVDEPEEYLANEKANDRAVRFSSHQNCYDYPSDKRNYREYSFRTPWANFY